MEKKRKESKESIKEAGNQKNLSWESQEFDQPPSRSKRRLWRRSRWGQDRAFVASLSKQLNTLGFCVGVRDSALDLGQHVNMQHAPAHLCARAIFSCLFRFFFSGSFSRNPFCTRHSSCLSLSGSGRDCRNACVAPRLGIAMHCVFVLRPRNVVEVQPWSNGVLPFLMAVNVITEVNKIGRNATRSKARGVILKKQSFSTLAFSTWSVYWLHCPAGYNHSAISLEAFWMNWQALMGPTGYVPNSAKAGPPTLVDQHLKA